MDTLNKIMNVGANVMFMVMLVYSFVFMFNNDYTHATYYLVWAVLMKLIMMDEK